MNLKHNRESQRRPRLKTDVIRRYVEKRLRRGWSPELIAGRLAIEHLELSISPEAIYRVYQEATHLILSLVRAHQKRKHRGYSGKHKTSHIPERISIQERPQAVRNLAKISQDHLVKIEYWLNNRPRKCLGFKTPAEVFKAECCT